MAESFVFSEFITKGKISNDAAAALEKEELDNYQALMDFSEHFEQGSPGLKISIAQKGLLRQALANLNGNVEIAENKFSSPVTSKDLQKDTKLNEFLNSLGKSSKSVLRPLVQLLD